MLLRPNFSKIRATYTDGNVEEFPNVREAEAGILETITGCDFAANVETVEAIGDKDEVLAEFNCRWGLTLWKLDKK